MNGYYVDKALEYSKKHANGLLELTRDICKIPAPSYGEEKRARFCLEYFKAHGIDNAYIDGAMNVILPIGCDGADEISVMCAHTDTVFSDTAPMSIIEDGKRLYCPGVGDDSVGVAVILYVARFLKELYEKEGFGASGLLLVANSCEEGLGNLNGMKTLFREYGGRIKRLVTLDSHIGTVINRCVGSHRYEVSVHTEGGHSFNDFGKENAINELSAMIREIYSIVPPSASNEKTTYNVGSVEGGTSVNTVAQSARMLCEYRSESESSLDIMKKEFEGIFDRRRRGVSVEYRLIGERPCMSLLTPCKEMKSLTALAEEVYRAIEPECRIELTQGSTDANIPLSLGIPAICIGVCKGAGAHTREEYVEKDSLPRGLAIAALMALMLCKHEENTQTS